MTLQDTMEEGLVSVVVPVLDDAAALRELLKVLQAAPFEIIVVDGGSADDGVAVARQAGATVIEAEANRGLQLDEGVRAAKGELIWMLHADARPTPANIDEISGWRNALPVWGCFDVWLDDNPWLRVVATLMNLRSALSGICTGDQGVFAHRHLLWAVGGVPRQPLMEDVELCKRLRRLAHPVRAKTPLVASPRRWLDQGIGKTIVNMWWLRLRYALGGAPETLRQKYYG